MGTFLSQRGTDWWALDEQGQSAVHWRRLAAGRTVHKVQGGGVPGAERRTETAPTRPLATHFAQCPTKSIMPVPKAPLVGTTSFHVGTHTHIPSHDGALVRALQQITGFGVRPRQLRPLNLCKHQLLLQHASRADRRALATQEIKDRVNLQDQHNSFHSPYHIPLLQVHTFCVH